MEQTRGEVRSYYQMAMELMERWVALEWQVLSVLLAKALQCPSELGSSASSLSSSPEENNTALQPSKILKFVIRRCEVSVLIHYFIYNARLHI